MCKVIFRELTFSTNSRFQVIDITSAVEKLVEESGVENGLVVIFAPHATAGIVLNEHEEGLLSDILRKLQELVPPEENYLHNRIDNNAHAHILSAIVKQFVLLPVKNGKIIRGTWQNILFLEFDGPRYLRRVVVEIVGEE